jgi:hypothetical protein
MRCRFAIAAVLLLTSAPAMACRCVTDSVAERTGHFNEVAASAQAVVVGRFVSKPRKDSRRFVVRERVLGSAGRQIWVRDYRLAETANVIVFSCGINARREGEMVLVLERRGEEANRAVPYDADACASSYFTRSPAALAQIRGRRRRAPLL